MRYVFDLDGTLCTQPERGDWTELTEKQLESWGVKYHKIRAGTKFAADLYIDDKGKNALDFFGDIK